MTVLGAPLVVTVSGGLLASLAVTVVGAVLAPGLASGALELGFCEAEAEAAG